MNAKRNVADVKETESAKGEYLLDVSGGWCATEVFCRNNWKIYLADAGSGSVPCGRVSTIYTHTKVSCAGTRTGQCRRRIKQRMSQCREIGSPHRGQCWSETIITCKFKRRFERELNWNRKLEKKTEREVRHRLPSFLYILNALAMRLGYPMILLNLRRHPKTPESPVIAVTSMVERGLPRAKPWLEHTFMRPSRIRTAQRANDREEKKESAMPSQRHRRIYGPGT